MWCGWPATGRRSFDRAPVRDQLPRRRPARARLPRGDRGWPPRRSSAMAPRDTRTSPASLAAVCLVASRLMPCPWVGPSHHQQVDVAQVGVTGGADLHQLHLHRPSKTGGHGLRHPLRVPEHRLEHDDGSHGASHHGVRPSAPCGPRRSPRRRPGLGRLATPPCWIPLAGAPAIGPAPWRPSVGRDNAGPSALPAPPNRAHPQTGGS